MDSKGVLKRLAAGIGRLPGVSQVLRLPSVRGMLSELPAARYLLAGSVRFTSWDRVHPFDLVHGTDTSGFVPIDSLAQLEHEAARAHARPYAGSQPSIVRTVLAALTPVNSFAFVDLGCGKGRPLLVASEFPFRDIVGIELSAALAETARHNADLIARRYPQRTPIRIVPGDATRFPLPPGNLVLFLYHPFGDAAIAKLAEAVNAALESAQRTVYVIYYNPIFGHRFDASPRLQRHLAATLPYAADELGYGPDADDPIVVWQGGITLAPADSRANARIEIVDDLSRVKLAPP
jgi:SAM-dependent methyltransferase